MDSSTTVIRFLVPSTIINYEKSPSSSYRIRLFFANGKRMDIGVRDHTYYYIDGNKARRDVYYNTLNLEECTKLYTCIPCRFLFESILLNGKYESIVDNINFYNSAIQET